MLRHAAAAADDDHRHDDDDDHHHRVGQRGVAKSVWQTVFAETKSGDLARILDKLGARARPTAPKSTPIYAQFAQASDIAGPSWPISDAGGSGAEVRYRLPRNPSYQLPLPRRDQPL